MPYFATVSAAKIPTTANYQTFTSSGSWTVPAGVTRVDVLVVAGGGGGGAQEGGGGGGGGYKEQLGLDISAAGSSITVTVGAGGVAGARYQGAGTPVSATNGSNSSFGSLVVATGGGKGYDNGANGATGGSGGGGGGSSGTQGSGTSGEGFGGGYGVSGTGEGNSGAGGGAGSAATIAALKNGPTQYPIMSMGGDGKGSAISGTYTFYSGGGGACTNGAPRSLAGIGGAGDGAYWSGSGYPMTAAAAGNGTANRGGGGGGGRTVDAQSGFVSAGMTAGAGGSGVVVLRWYT